MAYSEMQKDSRPRVSYTLPDGRQVPVIVDHAPYAPRLIRFQIENGSVVWAVRS